MAFIIFICILEVIFLKIPNPFDFTKEGKGIKKSNSYDVDATTLSGFFVTYTRKFWSLSTANIFYILVNFPIFFLLFAFGGFLDIVSPAPVTPMFQPVYGISLYGANPLVSALLGALSGETTVSVTSTGSYVFFALSALLFITFGLGNAGLAAVTRNCCRGDMVFVGQDFFGAIKRNWKQAIVLGAIDLGLLGLFIFNFTFYSVNGMTMMIYASIALLVVYFFMRFYMYTILVTFELSVFKIIKNSVIFALIGFARNIVATFGIILVLALNWYIVMLFMPVGVLLPFLITIATFSFVATCAVFPNIKKYMIDPYYSSSSSNKSSSFSFSDEPVFKDRG